MASDSRFSRAAAAALAVVLLSACAGVERNPNVVSPYSDKLSPYNYKEEGSVALMVVGVEGARFIRDERYVPLFVQVANRSKITFEITRESFTLEDSLANQYALVPSGEIMESYPRLDLDRRLFRQNQQFTALGVDLYNYVSSLLYPASTERSLVTNSVSLPPHTYMEDILYFPIPQTGLFGVPLRVLFKVKGLGDPIQVVFEVPKTLGIFEKDKDGKPKEKHTP